MLRTQVKVNTNRNSILKRLSWSQTKVKEKRTITLAFNPSGYKCVLKILCFLGVLFFSVYVKAIHSVIHIIFLSSARSKTFYNIGTFILLQIIFKEHFPDILYFILFHLFFHLFTIIDNAKYPF